MHEQFAVVFRDGPAEAAGALTVEPDHLLLHGRAHDGDLSLEISFADLSEVRIGRGPSERLNGYATLVLERTTLPPVQIAPLGVALLHEISDLLTTLSRGAGGDVLVVVVPLKPGCLNRARQLLEKGPPLDLASLGLSSHDVYLRDDQAIFVFRGNNVHAQLSKAIRHPAIWRAGLAWQRCFAASPKIVDRTTLSPGSDPTYHWIQPDHRQHRAP